MPYSKRKKIIYEMNVIPYIDVMLVLLLVFMIAAPLMYQGLEVNLPETTSKEINLNNFKEPLIIDVSGISDSDGVGEIYVQWQKQTDDSRWIDIFGATQQSFTPRQEHVGLTLSCLLYTSDAADD